MAETDSIARSWREYGRGLAGGLIFSLPLLYTMEVWWAGFVARPHHLLIYVACTFVLLLGYNRYVGLRRDASWTEVAIDSVEELGLGIITSAGVLYLLGRIHSGNAFEEVVGKVVVEAGLVAIGFSVGTAQLGGDADHDTAMGSEDEGEDEDKVSFHSQVVIAFCGAVLFAANVAPTEEVLLIGIESGPARLVAIALVSLLIAALILFFSEFSGSQQYAPIESHWEAIAHSVITYAIALVVSALILWFFGRFDGVGVQDVVSQTVVLGLPSTLGASAGRLLLQS